MIIIYFICPITDSISSCSLNKYACGTYTLKSLLFKNE